MIRKIAMAMVIVTAGFSFAACNVEAAPAPCSGLTVSEQDIEAAANGYEVERTDSQGYECELSQDGRSWSVDD